MELLGFGAFVKADDRGLKCGNYIGWCLLLLTPNDFFMFCTSSLRCKGMVLYIVTKIKVL